MTGLTSLRSASLYKILKANYYWFASVVYTAIKLRYSGVVEAESTKRAGYLGIIPITPAATDKAMVATLAAWDIKRQLYADLKTAEEVCIGMAPSIFQQQLTISC